MIRRCENCANWNQFNQPTEEPENSKTPLSTDFGYCKIKNLLHAYSLQNTCYAITKKHNLCLEHHFIKEGVLQEEAEKICITESVKNANAKHNTL